jgi:hypothetical protein
VQSTRWLRAWAEGYDSGLSQHHTDGVDDSKLIASMLRHEAGNIDAVISAYERLTP